MSSIPVMHTAKHPSSLPCAGDQAYAGLDAATGPDFRLAARGRERQILVEPWAALSHIPRTLQACHLVRLHECSYSMLVCFYNITRSVHHVVVFAYDHISTSCSLNIYICIYIRIHIHVFLHSRLFRLFIKYQIPSDLLSFTSDLAPNGHASAADRLQVVKGQACWREIIRV